MVPRYWLLPALLLGFLLLIPVAASAHTIIWEPLNEPGSGGKIASLAVSPYDANTVFVGGDMLGAARSTNGGLTWESTYGFSMWEMAEFTFHPTDARIVWLATAGGPYLSTDGGINWVSKRNGMPAPHTNYFSAPIQKIVYYDPADSSKLLAFGGSHREWTGGFTAKSAVGVIWHSTDHGENWVQVANLRHNITSAYVAADGDIYVAVLGAGVYKSSGDIKSWQAVNNGLPGGGKSVVSITGRTDRPDTLFVALKSYDDDKDGTYSPGGVYRTVDGGMSWTAANTGLAQNAGKASGSPSYSSVVSAPSAPDVLYASNLGQGRLYKSTNGGASWQEVLTGSSAVDKAFPAGPNIEFIAVDPNNHQTVYAGSSETIYKTVDGGATWEDVTATRVAGTERWTGRGFSGLVARGSFVFSPFQEGVVAFTGMDAGKLWLSKDNMLTWQRAANGLERWQGGRDLTFTGESGEVIYATLGQSSFRGIGRSLDGGNTWVMLSGDGGTGNGGRGQVAAGLPKLSSGGAPDGIYANPEDKDEVWAVIDGKLYKSSNATSNNSTWSVIGDRTVRYNRIAGVKGRTFYVTSDKGVYLTTDGVTFSSVGNFTHAADRIAVDPHNPAVIYVTRHQRPTHLIPNGLYKYDGAEWKRLPVPDSYAGNYIAGVAVDPFAPNRIVVTTKDTPSKDISGAEGVFMSEDGGVTWSLQNSGLPLLRAEVVVFNPWKPGELLLGTNGRGWFRGTLVEE